MAQISARSLAEQLKSIVAKKVTEADCALQLARAATSNGPELIYGGTVCDVAGKAVESSFLLSAGQLRALTDVLLMPPATQSDDQSLTPLYAMLYYGGGMGGVKDKVLREPGERQQFLKLLDEWAPAYSPTYDPGWNARKRPDPAKYQATVAEAKADIRKHLARAIHLLSDDRYYSLNRQFTQLLERNPKGVRAQTPEGKLADDLQKRMRERMIALGVDVGPAPPDPTDADVKSLVAGMQRDFPPHSPQKDESVLPGSTDPTVERCKDFAERTAVSQGGKIVRVLITSSGKWGTIWRADIAGGDQPVTRVTCTATVSSSSPLDIGHERIAPLSATTDEPQ